MTHQNSDEKRSVVVYRGHEFHRAMLDPVVDALQAIGLAQALIYTSDLNHARRVAPDVLVVADKTEHLFQQLAAPPLTVFTRHGFSSKYNAAPAMASCDFACVSSEHIAKNFRAMSVSPRIGFRVTGFSAMDIVFAKHQQRQAASTGVHSEPRKQVLLAPSFTPALSCADMVDASWIEAALAKHPNVDFLIKPHPVLGLTYPAALEQWRALAARNPRVRVVDDLNDNIYELFNDADIMVTDVSSVAFYYLALDRPIIFVDPIHPAGNPLQFDRNGPEWLWRDCGDCVASRDDFVTAISNALAAPERHSNIRQRYAAEIFGELRDAGASGRIADLVRALVAPTQAEAAWSRDVRHAARGMAQLRRVRNLPFPWIGMPRYA